MRFTAKMEFTELPYIVQEEFDFVLDDLEGMGDNPEWNRQAPREAYYDDGTGYAVSADTLLKGHPHTFFVKVDGEAFVWSYDTEQWCIVGEDL